MERAAALADTKAAATGAGSGEKGKEAAAKGVAVAAATGAELPREATEAKGAAAAATGGEKAAAVEAELLRAREGADEAAADGARAGTRTPARAAAVSGGETAPPPPQVPPPFTAHVMRSEKRMPASLLCALKRALSPSLTARCFLHLGVGGPCLHRRRALFV